MAGYVAHIPDWFPTRKAAQVAAFFAGLSGGAINVLKLTKLLYLSDRMSLDLREYPITGDNFVSMPFGPVNTYTYSLINGCADRDLDIWREYISARSDMKDPTIHIARTMNESDIDELSRADLRIMDQVWTACRDIDRFDLAEWTHRYCPEWRNPQGSSIPIEFATVFKHLNKSDPVELAETIQADRSLYVQMRNPIEDENHL